MFFPSKKFSTLPTNLTNNKHKKMRDKYIYLFLLLISISIFACTKIDDGYVDAQVVDTGDITSNGCGYILRFENGREEKPYQLQTAYQHNGMLVKVKYHSSEVVDTCGSAKPYAFYNLIIIEGIKRRNN